MKVKGFFIRLLWRKLDKGTGFLFFLYESKLDKKEFLLIEIAQKVGFLSSFMNQNYINKK